MIVIEHILEKGMCARLVTTQISLSIFYSFKVENIYLYIIEDNIFRTVNSVRTGLLHTVKTRWDWLWMKKEPLPTKYSRCVYLQIHSVFPFNTSQCVEPPHWIIPCNKIITRSLSEIMLDNNNNDISPLLYAFTFITPIHNRKFVSSE